MHSKLIKYSLKAYLLIIINLCFLFKVNAQTTNISGVVNSYVSVSSLAFQSVVVPSSTGFVVGDKVLLIQMKGATIDTTNTSSFGTINSYNDAGNYEMLVISAISSNTITFTAPILRTYNSIGLVQLVKVPVYNNVNVIGVLTCSPWNGSTGGVLVFEATGNISLNANIDVTGKGFLGGAKLSGQLGSCVGNTTGFKLPITSLLSTNKGEGITLIKPSFAKGLGALANGGGAGNDVNGGGAGGGNYGLGGHGGNSKCSSSPVSLCGGREGKNCTYSNSSNKIFLGGGGGAGHENDGVSSAGVAGGGIVIIRSGGTISGNGNFINANGNNNTLLAGNDGQGGGGAGGTVLIDACSTSSLSISVIGGNGGTDNFSGPDCHGKGGGGGGGAIWTSLPLSYTSFLNGGNPGVFNNAASQCFNTSNGATTGQIGGTLTGLIIPGSIPLTSINSFSINTFSNCYGGSNSSAIGTLTTTLSSPIISYTWTNSSGIIISQTNNTNSLIDSVSNIANGIYTLSVTLTTPCSTLSGSQTLTISCVSTPTQSCGGSLDFNNISDAVLLPLNNQIYNSNGFTWECWFKLNTPFATDGRSLIFTEDPVVYEDIFLGFGWSYGTGNFPINHLGFKVDGPNATTGPTNISCDYAPPGGFLLGTWYHAAGVMDYTSHTAKLYLNGALVDTKTVNSDPLTRIIQTRLSDGSSIALGGNEDEVRIWNRVRTASEIAADYNQCLTGTETDLLLYYRCNQSSGLIVTDATPNGNNGSIINSTNWSTQQPNVSGLGCSSGVNLLTSSSPTICSGSNATLTATGATSYTWANSATLSSSTGTAVIASPNSTTNYTVTGANAACSNTAIVTVNVLATPNITLSPNVSICQGVNATATLTASGASTYTWVNSATLSSSTGSAVIASPNITTNYTVTGVNSACSNTAVVTVSVNPSPTITAISVNNTSCGLANGNASVTSLPANNTYTWSSGVSSTTNTASNLAAGNYTVTAIDGACQTSSTIAVLSSIPLSITGSTITPTHCTINDGSISVTDNLSSSTYSWTPMVSSINNATNLATGNYSLTITNGACSTSSVFIVTQINGPTALNCIQNNAICESNGNIKITNVVNGLAPYQYSFNNSGFSTITTYTNLTQGIYTVTVKDANSCLYTQTLSIVQTTINSIVALTTNTPNCESNDGSFVIDSIKGGTPPYLTSFNNTLYTSNMTFENLSTGSYTLNVRDSNMCETGFILIMPENNRDYTLYIPNTFTPNKDNVNDIWYVQGTCLGEFNCLIYNRWGEKIRELRDITEGWDGTYRGASVPDGVYVYLIEVNTKEGTINKAGHITVFR